MAQRILSSSYFLAQPITVSVSGAGRVLGTPGGIDCGVGSKNVCKATFSSFTYVKLSAAPAPGATFLGWSGSCSGTGLYCKVSNAFARDVRAVFSQPATVAPTTYTLSTSVTGKGTVASQPAGILCGAAGTSCSTSFKSGTAVTLTATAPAGYSFSGWSGACSGTASTCTVSMSGARSVGAAFTQSPTTYALSVSVAGTGSVKSTPAGIDCGGSATACKSYFGAGSSVTLSAVAPQGYTFTGWKGACSGTSSTCTVPMNGAQSVEAGFAATVTSAPTSSSACTQVYSSGATLVSGKVVSTIPSLAKPVKGKAFAEPTYKTCVTRVTDHAVEPPSGFARNDYSRRQAFNADSSKLLVYALDGFWHVYDARTMAYVKKLVGPGGDAEPQWHPSDPNLLYYLPSNGVGMKLYELNVATDQTRVVGDFGARLKARWPGAAAAWTKSEGSPSADGRYWCFMVDDANWNGVGVFTWDRDTNTILGMKSTNGERPDHVSMSPSGNYCVVSSDGASGTVAYSRDFSQQKKVHHKSEHSDIALDENGDDVYVAIDYQSNAGDVFMVNLRTGVRTVLFPTYLSGTATALHVSGKAYNKRGWVVISTYADGGGSLQWLHRKVMAVQLRADPVIYHLAHHHSAPAGYWTEPHASVNRDFTKILFNSNWDVASENIDTYMVELPAGAIK
ncbi:InlB B-repeat-containing protein [Caldimonas aquatica]|uniref:InlB B-repeat-containing protein n=1 Tax=Caldimonas aquatica TaxID=376175 RepID=A0ABY6MW11_9BURK|nr:InlB B-repeat-containing protein [Schlegelella aquatica]UZD56197.1 InlB B-repeat-containing protein [Schlegelella aquatica]